MSIEAKFNKDLKGFILDIELEFQDEIIALLGESGSGKSMTLKSIAGLVKPDDGFIKRDEKILFDSSNKINLEPRKRNIGFLFQSFALFPNMTINKNLKFVNPNISDEKINELLDTFEILHLKDRYPYQLSGGQKQRAALARVMATNPKLLLLDEPFSSLDTNLRWRMEKFLRDFLQDYEHSSIIVTHDKDEAFRLCDKVAIIEKGRIVNFGDKKAVYENPQTVSAAKILGYKNFLDIKKVNSNKVKIDETENYLELNQDIKDDTKFIGLDSNKFSLNQSSQDNKLNVEINSIIEDTENIVLFFGDKKNIMTAEIPKINIAKSDFQDLTSNLGKKINLYYPKDKILQLSN